jgi:hypothetical protein
MRTGFLLGILDLFAVWKRHKTYRTKYMLSIDDSFQETPLFMAVDRSVGKYSGPLQHTAQYSTGQRGYTGAELRRQKTNQPEKEFCFES